MIHLILISFFVNFVITKIIIKHSKNFANPIRKFTQKTHSQKPQTSSFGGIAIFLTTTLLTLIFINSKYYIFLIPTFIIFALGLFDDFKKLLSSNGHGVSAKQKFLVQFISSTILCFIVYNTNATFNTFKIVIPFLQIYTITLPTALAFIIIFFTFVGTINAVNLTDGLDGLAGKQSLLILIFIVFYLYKVEYNPNLNNIIFIVLGALIAFLIFNSNPASIIMGDAGSMGIGALIATFFIILKIELIMPVLCLVFFIEALSVIMQVVYFKITKGKRIFKMSPLHHHFQLTGIKEQKIVEVSFLTTLILVLLFLSPFYA